MNEESSVQKLIKCGLSMTDNASRGIKKYAKDAAAFFSIERAFDVYIEKRPENRQGTMSFSIFFDNISNQVLAKHLNDRVAVMECVYKSEGFLATGFHVRGRRESVRTNRRLPARMKFQLGSSAGIKMPVEFYMCLRELPIAEERSEYVKKRITSWEGYLRIQEKNADVADITSTFSVASLNEDFSKLRLICTGLNHKELNQIKGFSAKMKGAKHDFGSVVHTNRAKKMIEIELNRKTQELARRNDWHPKTYQEVIFSNFAELSQVKRLRKGFKDLEDGLAANANLEKVLFEERPVVRISNKQKQLDFHNDLNDFQKKAVTGAMTANDLYVIQGPPGTGKTTVISEICYQNVKAGLRTLVASQANLAVDNALGRLLSHQDIRILRYGRTESIEEEGKKFIEENVALNWKAQTIADITEELESHANRKVQLADELDRNQGKMIELEQKLAILAEKISLKKAAEKTHRELSEEIQIHTEKRSNLTEKHDLILSDQVELQKRSEALAIDIERLELIIASESIDSKLIGEMEIVGKETDKLRIQVSYRNTLTEIDATMHFLGTTEQAIEMKQSIVDNLDAFLKALHTITKLDGLNRCMGQFSITPSFGTNQKINGLKQLITRIKPIYTTDTFSDWYKLDSRLHEAIETVGKLLASRRYVKQAVKRGVNRKYTSVSDINQLIDRVGHFLVQPETMRVLGALDYSTETYKLLEKMDVSLSLLQERSVYAKSQLANVDRLNQMVSDSKNRFAIIKQEIMNDMGKSLAVTEQELVGLKWNMENSKRTLNNLKEEKSKLQAALGNVDEIAPLRILTETLSQKEKKFADYMEKKIQLARYTESLEANRIEAKVTETNLTNNVVEIQALHTKIQFIGAEIGKLEVQRNTLVEILEGHPEVEREQTFANLNTLREKVDALQKEINQLPVTYGLQKEWLTYLKEANAYDLDEIRKLYVKYANVIGTTCVASARRDFMEEYPVFDVVIIDEVSKATPPELLLPMLKGKKIILVGDHHQLPPLVGQETMEEFLEEIDSTEERNDLKKLLKESLFERLFRTLPEQNKMMLAIQYRMHANIMETIAPFYESGNHRLQCGLTDSDAARDHLIDSRYVQRRDHLLWFDMPNKPNYFEERVKGGTSRFNPSELKLVKDLLIDLDTATEQVKTAHGMHQDTKKNVGVISFYGEQVKRIDRMIQQELMPKHLHCRTGSVDKFQGMEMDIIILSFVRNHSEKGGDIGFAKDYRRLNVALSRARELLIIVGSSEMFTIRTKDKDSKAMYGRLLAEIKKHNGFRDAQGKVKL